ncbi:MAG: matrixin family metalloprotease [Bacteroidetes bacterium]|jgi:hypothetical protein|nr:matrixin family metalloprotease [Bacteroidota bacterium]
MFICITAFLAAGLYIYGPTAATTPPLHPSEPCQDPLYFDVGDIDSRFVINRKEATAAARDAASLWNTASNTLLAHRNSSSDHPADITIHFVYDERQRRSDAEYRFREQIRARQTQLDQRKEQHEERRARFKRESERYERFAKRTARELSDLNAWVSEKNEAGGFKEDEFKEFEKRKAGIEQRQQQVLRLQDQLSSQAQSINREMENLNREFDKLNDMTDRYNEEFAGSMKFTKATYQRRGSGGEIKIHQFMSKSELRLIIAHELGHALGIGHLANPESVMFNLMGEQDLYPEISLTRDDRQAAEAVCQ